MWVPFVWPRLAGYESCGSCCSGKGQWFDERLQTSCRREASTKLLSIYVCESSVYDKTGKIESSLRQEQSAQ